MDEPLHWEFVFRRPDPRKVSRLTTTDARITTNRENTKAPHFYRGSRRAKSTVKQDCENHSSTKPQENNLRSQTSFNVWIRVYVRTYETKSPSNTRICRSYLYTHHKKHARASLLFEEITPKLPNPFGSTVVMALSK